MRGSSADIDENSSRRFLQRENDGIQAWSRRCSGPPADGAQDAAPAAAPLSLQLGGVAFTPTGFFEYSQIWRSKMVSSGLPTSFAGVPFADTVEGHRRHMLYLTFRYVLPGAPPAKK